MLGPRLLDLALSYIAVDFCAAMLADLNVVADRNTKFFVLISSYFYPDS